MLDILVIITVTRKPKKFTYSKSSICKIKIILVLGAVVVV